MATVGILGLQGCIEPHEKHFASVGVETLSVRFADEFARIDALLIPGGESTTMLRLLHRNNLFQSVMEFVSSKPTWGVCAGSILLAQQVANPEQESFEAARIRAERNSYGSQLDSFSTEINIEGFQEPFLVDFIRAPRLSPLHDEVEILASSGDDCVLLRDQNVLTAAFHTELTNDERLHRYFVEEFLR